MAASEKKHPAVKCFDALFQSSDFCFAVATEDGQISAVNPGLGQLLGCDTSQLPGTQFSALLATPAHVQTSTTEAALSSFFKKPFFMWRSRLNRHDGSTVEVRLVSRRDAVSGCVLVEFFPQDSSAGEIENAAAAADGSFLENVFSSVGDGLYVTDELGHIIKANPALAKMLGYSQQDLIGKHFVDFMTWQPDGRAGAEPGLMEQLLSRGVIENYEALWRKKNGVLLKVALNVTLLKNSTGAMIGAVGAVRDITQRTLSDAALRESEKQFRTITDSTFDAIIAINSSGLITFWNSGACRIFGFDACEVLGKPVAMLVPERLQQQDALSMSNALQDEPSLLAGKTLEQTYRRKNGIEFAGELSLAALYIGGVLSVSAVVRDISERKKVESAMRESEQRFRVLANSATDGIIFFDSRGEIIFWNQGAQKIYGYDYKEMLGKTAETIMVKDLLESSAGYIKQAPGTDAAFPDKTFESFGVHKNGTRFPVEVSLSSGRAGNALFYCAIVRNISERKKIEEALRESEERFRVLAESLPEGIIAVDSRGAIVFWNTGAQNLFGYTRDEALGKPSTLLIPDRYHQTEKEGLNTLRQQGYSNFQGRTVQGLAKRRDGTEFTDEISVGPWPTRQGLYYVAIIRDITERLKAEQALRESEQRFKELADALPQTVFELNLDGMITFINRTALETFGRTQSDIDKGMHALHMIVPEQRIVVRENIEKVFSGERLGGQEYTALRKDGTTFPCIIHASPILADDKPQGLRGLLIDITLRKELEEEMNKSKRLASISTLAGGVAQDFNTILSIILGNINLAQHQVAPDDRLAEHLSAAERATLRAKDLTGQLIAFAKGGTALKTFVSVEKLLRDATDAALKGSNVICSFSFPEDLERTELDEAQMRQVFINLLVNADQAMPEGGSIDVKAGNITVAAGDNLPLPNGAYVKITIKDQSIGILNEHLQQLFDPYFTSRQRGSGIGLATTYTIIKNHGGLITVESEFGRGTTFHVFLPASKSKK